MATLNALQSVGLGDIKELLSSLLFCRELGYKFSFNFRPCPSEAGVRTCAFEEAQIAFHEDEQGPGKWRSQTSNPDSLRPEHRSLTTRLHGL